jgi:intraflagellar transport protein 140
MADGVTAVIRQFYSVAQYWDALKLCMEQHVPMTEELVEKLTPSKEMEERDADERNKIIEGIGEVCMAQRQYHLATKKFTQCGNRVKVSFCVASSSSCLLLRF